ncbi:MAG: leucine-rich repeat protein [Clostridia bacterium]|nr:leucine-rich repeat protein [Clostridia bacterium]
MKKRFCVILIFALLLTLAACKQGDNTADTTDGVPTVPSTTLPPVTAGDWGAAGAEIHWAVDGDTLTISGTGDLKAIPTWADVPWRSQLTKLKTVVVEKGVTSLPDYAFTDCENLTAVKLPKTLKSIGLNAFENCVSLETITLPAGVTTIGRDAFKNCTALREVTLSDAMTALPDELFYGCTALKTVTLPAALKTVGSRAFMKCESLPALFLPATVTAFGEDILSLCSGFRGIYYAGTKAQWKKVYIDPFNDILCATKVHYNATAEDLPA